MQEKNIIRRAFVPAKVMNYSHFGGFGFPLADWNLDGNSAASGINLAEFVKKNKPTHWLVQILGSND